MSQHLLLGGALSKFSIPAYYVGKVGALNIEKGTHAVLENATGGCKGSHFRIYSSVRA